MRASRRRVAIAGALGIAIAVPAVVIAGAISPGPSGQGLLTNQAVWSTSSPVQTSSTSFEAVPTMNAPGGLPYNSPLSVDVSADMRQGAAKFRVVAVTAPLGTTPSPLHPASALFAGRGSSSFQFITGSSETDRAQFEVQWKRDGDVTAKAASVTATLSGDIDP